ncbi:MAG: hypothetical protein II839_02380 [Kiritimatiellae bacterium]|nr:hypothetical protein [Kiritimatiellia bacterium]
MTSAEQIARLDVALRPFPVDYAFIGGGVLSLLVTDPSASAVRVTMDVDVLTDTHTRRDYQRLERPLAERGFHHDMTSGAPICRWRYEGIVVDILPIHRSVLGWESRWFREALASARPVRAGDRSVRIVSAPYFVALKLEAFEDRGRGDMIMSHDFEDVICLFDGRPELVGEIRAAPEDLRRYLSERFARYLAAPDLEAAVEGFVQTEPSPESRMVAILSRFREVAALAPAQP